MPSQWREEPSYDKDRQEEKDESSNTQPSVLEIPRLLMQREADKKKEYAQRAKIDVKEILSDKEAQEVRVADKDQDFLFRADPDRGQLLSAEKLIEGDDDDFEDDDDDDLLGDGSDEKSLNDLIKDPLAKKKQMLTP